MALNAPTSEVAICNLALIMVKQPTVTQIDPLTSTSTKAEELCNRLYQQVRRATIRGHTWNFALKRITISPNAIAPLFGFTHAYDLPPDFLRYVSRHDDLGARPSPRFQIEDYQLEGGQILLNGEDSTAINIRYLFDATTVSTFDSLFIQLFAVNLAIELAPNFSASPAVKRDLITRQANIKAEAMAVDGQERPPIRVERSRWNEARRTGSSDVASKFTKFN